MSSSKITLLISSLRGGGAERVCVTLANQLFESGWDVELLVLHMEDAVYESDLNKKIQLKVFNKRHARSALFTLAKFIINRKPETFLVFNHQLAVCLAILRLILNRKFKIVARNISTLSLAKKNQKSIWHKYFSHYIVKALYRKVDLIIAQSTGMRDDLQENYVIPKNKLIVIHNPLNARLEEYVKKKNSRTGDDYLPSHNEGYFLCVGRLEPVKAFDFAIRAFSVFVKCFPGFRLKLIGSGGQEKKLKGLVKSLNLEASVDFISFQKDLIPYYINAKATILTSLYEGFPNVLIESIALGTPVVAFDCESGPRDIVFEGINGYLVRYQDENHLVMALKMVACKDWNRSVVSATAARYSSAIILKRYIDVLSQ